METRPGLSPRRWSGGQSRGLLGRHGSPRGGRSGPVRRGARRGDPVIGSPRIERLQVGAGRRRRRRRDGSAWSARSRRAARAVAAHVRAVGAVAGVLRPGRRGRRAAGRRLAGGARRIRRRWIGLAAATTATPPTVNRAAARASVAIVRRIPKPRTAGSAGTTGSAGPAVAGWSFHSMKLSVLRCVDEAALDLSSSDRLQLGLPAHGNRLNQRAARPTPTTTNTRPAAAKYWVTSCSS